MVNSSNTKGASDEVKSKINAINSDRMKANTITRGQSNGMCKLTSLQVLEIKELQKNHYRGQDGKLAKIYGVSRELIRDIRYGSLRKHA